MMVTVTAAQKALPETAVAAMDESYYILIVDKETTEGYTFLKKRVKVGDTYNGFTEIEMTDVIATTEKILTKGTFNLIV